LISTFNELCVISSIRLSTTLDRMVRVCRAARLDDFLDMALEKSVDDFISFE
jgi:hypothetical protein